MDEKKVSELAKQVRGVSYKPEDLHNSLDDNSVILLRANNINDGKINFEDVVYVDKSKVSKEQYLCKGDILICASSGSKQLVGKAASIDFDIECTFGAFCKVVRPNSDIADYLGTYFQSNSYRQKISGVAIGANINNIRNEHIDSLVVSVGTNEENAEAVRVMTSIQKVIDGRKQELQKLDRLVKARFVEMFGDPNTNTKNWPMGKISDIGRCVAGATPSTAKKEYWENGTIPWLSSGEVNKGRVYETDAKITQLGYENASTKMVPAKTVILAMAGQGKTRGTAAITEIELCTNQSICSIVNNEKVNAEYLLNFLKLQYKELRNASTSSEGRGGLNLKIIGDYPIMIPPIELQNDYETFCKQLDKSKVAVQAALDEAQLLFDSLMQKYFG